MKRHNAPALPVPRHRIPILIRRQRGSRSRKLGTEFWDDLDIYRKHSALFNVKAVRTPTLIQHGDKDEGVPISQGYKLYILGAVETETQA